MRIDDAVDHAGGVHPQQRRPSGRRDAASEGVNRPLDRNLHRPRLRPDDVDRTGILNAAVGHAISRDPARQLKTKLRMVGTLDRKSTRLTSSNQYASSIQPSPQKKTKRIMSTEMP